MLDETKKKEQLTRIANAKQARADINDQLNMMQRAVNGFIANGINELSSWQPKMDDRFNSVRSALVTLDSWWESILDVSERD